MEEESAGVSGNQSSDRHSNGKRKRKQKQLNDFMQFTKRQKNVPGIITGEQQKKFNIRDPRNPQIKCPALTQKQIKLMLNFIDKPKHHLNDRFFIKLFAEDSLGEFSEAILPSYLWYWGKILEKRVVQGVNQLGIRATEKLVLAKERHETIVEEAHEGIGHFIWATVVRDDKGRALHNDYKKTLELISADYGVGDREFGIDKQLIYQHISSCGCSWKVKKLPSLEKLKDSSQGHKTQRRTAMAIADGGNENRHISTDDAPVTMLWPTRDESTVWHDQKGLAGEPDQYLKLLGVIKELGLEVGAMTQGDTKAASRFLTKLYCADRFVKEAKNKVMTRSTHLKDSTFITDYIELRDYYIEMNRLDLFLYDVNILARKYKLQANPTFLKMVKRSISSFKNASEQLLELQKKMETNENHQEEDLTSFPVMMKNINTNELLTQLTPPSDNNAAPKTLSNTSTFMASFPCLSVNTAAVASAQKSSTGKNPLSTLSTTSYQLVYGKNPVIPSPSNASYSQVDSSSTVTHTKNTVPNTTNTLKSPPSQVTVAPMFKLLNMKNSPVILSQDTTQYKIHGSSISSIASLPQKKNPLIATTVSPLPKNKQLISTTKNDEEVTRGIGGHFTCNPIRSTPKLINSPLTNLATAISNYNKRMASDRRCSDVEDVATTSSERCEQIGTLTVGQITSLLTSSAGKERPVEFSTQSLPQINLTTVTSTANEQTKEQIKAVPPVSKPSVTFCSSTTLERPEQTEQSIELSTPTLPQTKLITAIRNANEETARPIKHVQIVPKTLLTTSTSLEGPIKHVTILPKPSSTPSSTSLETERKSQQPIESMSESKLITALTNAKEKIASLKKNLASSSTSVVTALGIKPKEKYSSSRLLENTYFLPQTKFTPAKTDPKEATLNQIKCNPLQPMLSETSSSSSISDQNKLTVSTGNRKKLQNYIETELEKSCLECGVTYAAPPEGESTRDRKTRRQRLRREINASESECSISDQFKLTVSTENEKTQRKYIETELEKSCLEWGVTYVAPPEEESTTDRKNRRQRLRREINASESECSISDQFKLTVSTENRKTQRKHIETELQKSCVEWGVTYVAPSEEEPTRDRKTRRQRLRRDIEARDKRLQNVKVTLN